MLLDFLYNRISLLELVFGLVCIVIAITIHEFSHAYSAYLLGDPTAKLRGRMTLDPTVHLDRMGSLMMLLFSFGWGKPVPINTTQIRKGRVGVALVSLAGPLSNFALAIIVGLLFRFELIPFTRLIASLGVMLIGVNLGLGVFNLLPFGPLDGYKIALGLLPPKWAYRIATLGMTGQLMWFMLFIVVLFDPIFGFVYRSFFSIVVGW